MWRISLSKCWARGGTRICWGDRWQNERAAWRNLRGTTSYGSRSTSLKHSNRYRHSYQVDLGDWADQYLFWSGDRRCGSCWAARMVDGNGPARTKRFRFHALNLSRYCNSCNRNLINERQPILNVRKDTNGTFGICKLKIGSKSIKLDLHVTLAIEIIYIFAQSFQHSTLR